MPEVDLGDGVTAPAAEKLDLSPMMLGRVDGQPSWAERMLGLRESQGIRARSSWRTWKPCCGPPTCVRARPRDEEGERGANVSEPLSLDGCTPEPLMGYLKALGVLRLVSEQADPEARGFWRDGVFVLETKLDRDGLAKFFLEQYSPTPLLAPWNGGSGFYIKLDLDQFLDTEGKEIEFKGREAVDGINAVEASDSERLARYRGQIRETKQALAALAEKVDFAKALADPLRQWAQAKTKPAQKKVKDEATKVLNTMLLFRSGEATFSIGKAAKDEFVSDLRGKVLTDDGLLWLDAALAMRTGQKKNRVESPTLGSGGNIGNSDFSARFAQLLPEVMPLRTVEPIPDGSAAWLNAAPFGGTRTKFAEDERRSVRSGQGGGR